MRLKSQRDISALSVSEISSPYSDSAAAGSFRHSRQVAAVLPSDKSVSLLISYSTGRSPTMLAPSGVTIQWLTTTILKRDREESSEKPFKVLLRRERLLGRDVRHLSDLNRTCSPLPLRREPRVPLPSSSELRMKTSSSFAETVSNMSEVVLEVDGKFVASSRSSSRA